jgi:hypothetical protein
MSWILSFLIKNWRIAGGSILLAIFLVAVWLAQERGRARDEARAQLAEAYTKYTAHIRLLEHSIKDKEERDEFRMRQNGHFKKAGNPPVELDAGLRAAYDGLRKRQRAAATH